MARRTLDRRGKLIVIDGTDGSGKATQTKLLVESLKRAGMRVRTLDFPGYERNFFGKFIGECLTGLHGDFVHLDPKIASLIYAADRFESKKTLEKWLAAGYVIILDRYVSSNQIHQGGKITNPKERKEFLRWLDHMEYTIFNLPRPDAIIFLSVPTALSRKLLLNKDLTKKKTYTRGAADAHESDPSHLSQARKSALRTLAADRAWRKIECAPKGALLSREKIHDLMMTHIAQILRSPRRRLTQ